MDLLRISDSKLKVTLTEGDMEKYRLDGESMDYDTTETRSAFWQILDTAKRETGFDAGGGRLFVQVYPSRGGGCEMYVTLLTEDTDTADEEEPLPLSVRSIYAFATLSDLITACQKLCDLGYTGESAVFAGEEGYSLVISERWESGLGEYAFLEEYGTRRSGGIRLSYLKEHERCLREGDAVSLFSTL